MLTLLKQLYGHFMDVATKYKIVEKIINSEDELLLGEIKDLLAVSEKDFWNGL